MDNSSIIKTIEDYLISCDIRKFLRSQNIAALFKESPNEPHIIYHEVYVSLIHFKKLFEEKSAGCSNHIINQILFEKLDLIVLEAICQDINKYSNAPIGINILVEAILKEEFLHFLKRLPLTQKESLIVEIQISDIFYDIQVFMKAKNILKEHNIKTCLDGINNLSLLQIDRKALGIDFVKLQWNIDIAKAFTKEENKMLIEKIKSCDPNRIILSRCDDEKAVNYGHSLGINMFQGWHIDRILGIV